MLDLGWTEILVIGVVALIVIGPERSGVAMAHGGPAPTPTDALCLLGLADGNRQLAADGLASPSQTRALWRHWGRPRLVWYRGGHVSFVIERVVGALLEEALVTTGLVSRVAAAPLLAPAIAPQLA